MDGSPDVPHGGMLGLRGRSMCLVLPVMVAVLWFGWLRLLLPFMVAMVSHVWMCLVFTASELPTKEVFRSSGAVC